MDLVRISCPYCGLSKTVPREKAPTRPVRANCPKCKHQFPIHPDKLPSVDPDVGAQPGVTQMPPPVSSAGEKIDPHAGLGGSPESMGALFSQSFGIFSGRFLTLFGLYLLMFVMVLVPTLLFGGGTFFLAPVLPGLSWLVLPAGGLLTAIVATYFLFWGYAAFVHAVIDQTCGFGDALRRGREQVWSFLWALSLSVVLITGGYFLFFLPGVLFGVWFLFVPFILAAERERGMDALLKSYEYVKGHWWNTFFKLFILMLVCGAVGAIPLVGWVLSLLTTPFMLIYMFTMYYDLQQIRGNRPVTAPTGRKAKWIAAGTIGYVVLPVVVLVMAGGSLTGAFKAALSESGLDFNLPRPEAGPQTQPQSSLGRQQQPSPPPQKVLVSNATLSVTKTRVEPGGTIFVNFHGIEAPAPKDWVALYRQDDPNEQYGEWEYLNSRSDGTVTFLAPSRPGVYEARLFLDWPDGGYHDVARSEPIVVGDAPALPAVEPGRSDQPASPLDRFRPKNRRPSETGAATSFDAQVADPSKLLVYVYSLNYKGEVRLNGESFYDIKGEKDMNYTYTGGQTRFSHGHNTIDVVYDAVPDDPWTTRVQVKVYAYDFDSGRESVVADWSSEAPNGRTQLTLDLRP